MTVGCSFENFPTSTSKRTILKVYLDMFVGEEIFDESTIDPGHSGVMDRETVGQQIP